MTAVRVPAAVLLLLLSTALGVGADTGGEHWGERIAAVQFQSKQRLDPRALLELVPLKVGQPLAREDLEEAKRLLQLKHLWSSITVEQISGKRGVAVVFHLVRKIVINSTSIEGNDTFWAEDLMRRVRIPSGTFVEPDALEAAAKRVEDYYSRQGFDLAKVDVEEHPARNRSMDVTFVIHEGEPQRIGAIELAGHPVFSKSELEKALAVKVGDRFDRDKERAAKKALIRFYRDRKYYAVAVTSSWERPSGSRSGTLRFEIRSGSLFAVVFSGDTEMSNDDMLGLIDLGERPVITDGTWRDLARRIKEAYQKRGYYRAKVDVNIGDSVSKRVEFKIDGGRPFFISRINFVGNKKVSDGQLQSVMETAPRSWLPFVSPGTLLDDTLKQDLSNIWYLYRRLGFASAQVVDSRTEFDEKKGTIALTIEVDEGPRSIVKEVELENFGAVKKMPALETKKGEPYNPRADEADVKTLETALRGSGYPNASVKSTTDDVRAGDGVETTVHFAATLGEYRTLGPVVVQGNELTLDRVILRELPFKEGDPYDPEKLLAGQGRVYKLGLFRRVTVRPIQEVGPVLKPEAPLIGIKVDERDPGNLQYGFGYDTQLGFHTFGQVSYDNLWGTARRASLRGDVNLAPTNFTPDEYLGDLGFKDPRLLGSRWTSTNNVILQRSVREIQRYSIERFAVISSLDRDLFPGFTVGGEVQFDQSDVFDVPIDVLDDPRLAGVKDEGFLRTISLGPFTVWDRRDDPFNPTQGTMDSLRVRYSVPQLFSDLHYVKVVSQHTQYFPIVDGVVFVYSLRAWWAKPLDGKVSVPIRERFFLGGRTTVRGFDENALGPAGSAGHPLGGDFATIVNTELRFPLYFGFGGVVFVDGGGLYLQKQPVRFDDFRRSAGPGIRYVTPVGAISLEYGVKLDRRPGESIGAIHFSIGSTF